MRIAPNEVSGLDASCLGLGGRDSLTESPPSQLHFAKPTVYNEIYNSQNKWDKYYNIYRVFTADESFFVQPDYLKAKHGRALVSNMFSKRAISEIQHLIRGQVGPIVYPICDASCLIGFEGGSIM